MCARTSGTPAKSLRIGKTSYRNPTIGCSGLRDCLSLKPVSRVWVFATIPFTLTPTGVENTYSYLQLISYSLNHTLHRNIEFTISNKDDF
jgi:hypothetical protein